MIASRPVLLLCPARNACQELVRSLPTWELIADKIIVADQNSTDGSREYLQSREKVLIIDNLGKEYDEVRRNTLLVAAAREIHEGAIHLTLDADEILSSNVIDSPEWRHFRQMEPGTVGEFNWIQLWKTPEKYIAKGVGGPTRYSLAFIDDGRPVEGRKRMHEQRGVGVQCPDRKFVFNDVVCLHYAWVNVEGGIRRNNYYKVHWVTEGAKSYHRNNRNHGWYRKVHDMNIAITPSRWFAGYMDRGLDVTSISQSSLYWWDIEVLRTFKKVGIEKFYSLDIWREVDWEQLRLIALAKKIDGIDDKSISAPSWLWRNFQALTVDGVDLAGTLRKVRRFVAVKLLP
jgi:Glycosyl transferase family 2